MELAEELLPAPAAALEEEELPQSAEELRGGRMPQPELPESDSSPPPRRPIVVLGTWPVTLTAFNRRRLEGRCFGGYLAKQRDKQRLVEKKKKEKETGK